MTLSCDEHAVDIISLKRPTTLDKWASAIPKPKGAIPNFGLPRWKVMPLDSKIPMVPGPAGAYNFTRRKMGKQLWVPPPDAEFNLNDPYCYEMKFEYDPFHDKHLAIFFSNPRNARHLINAGLVAENFDAKCSLRDYNMYRQYLRKLHCETVRRELKKQSRLCDEERAIQFAESEARKEVKKLMEKEKLMEASKETREKRKQLEKARLQKQRDKILHIQQRLESLARMKQEEQKSRNAKMKMRTEFIREKQKAAKEIERRKIMNTLLQWNKKERVRMKMRLIRTAHEEEKKRKFIAEKWTERQQCQKEQIEKEHFLLECINTRQKEFIKQYTEKIAKETERMQRLFEEMKTFLRCYMTTKLAGSKERICCKREIGDLKSSTGTAKLHPASTKHSEDKASKEKTKRKAETRKNKLKKNKQESIKKESLIESEDKQSLSDKTDGIMSTIKTDEISHSLPTIDYSDSCRCKMIKARKQSKTISKTN